MPTQAPDFAAFPVDRFRQWKPRSKGCGCSNVEHGVNATLAGIWKVTLRVRSVNTFPYEGKGDRLRWMRSAIARYARWGKSRPPLDRA